MNTSGNKSRGHEGEELVFVIFVMSQSARVLRSTTSIVKSALEAIVVVTRQELTGFTKSVTVASDTNASKYKQKVNDAAEAISATSVLHLERHFWIEAYEFIFFGLFHVLITESHFI